MRSSLSVAAVLLIIACACSPLARAAIDEKHSDAASIAALEQKASQAQPKEQCYLYAELVHSMIEYSSAEYAAGDYDKAADTLKHIPAFAAKIHGMMAKDEKRLKDAQILLRHTAFRLTELLHASSIDDRPLVEQTLAQVNQIQTETMLQVFQK